jgi:3',5'-nucleoside bisphosphate phosphatase
VDLDLHLHSNASDGRLAPADLVQAAVEARLDVIALTDHDTVAGVAPAQDAARQHPIDLIPALEVSSTWEATEIHVLGYFVDPAEPALVRHAEVASERRARRLEEMVDRLRDQGVDVAFDRVVALAGDEAWSLGRPHLARALLEAGYVATVSEAFDRFIGNGHPAYLPTRLLDPGEAIELIHGAGGLAVWAHPPVYLLDALLPRLAALGLDGLEVHRPRTPPDRVELLSAAARGVGLFVTGGSDWHGPDDGPLGTFRVDSREVAEFLEAGGL